MSSRKKLYYLIHKPYGYLSQFTDEAGNAGLGQLYKLPKDVYPVGRLDLDSEGLLLLTNDKILNNILLNPANQHERTYWVEVDGVPDEGALEKLREGVEINVKGMHHTLPARAAVLTDVNLPDREPPVNVKKHPVRSWLEISLIEGKNRQVRKMTAKIGHPTLRLLRVAIESVGLGDMKPGALVQISGKVLYKKLGIEVDPS